MKEQTESLVGRREVIKLTAGALITPALPQTKKRTAKPVQPVARFFTPAELALVDELAELIIPADDHSPGARAARAAAFIDQQLAEAIDEEPRLLWRNGLQSLDALSTKMNGVAMMQATPAQRVAVLEAMARNEADPKTPEEKFFVALKTRVAYAYYTSKVGIHDELEYKGNTYQREFAGTDVSR